MPSLTITALQEFPLVKAGDDLTRLITDSLRSNGLETSDQDVVVIAQKVVSKAEGRYIDLKSVIPGQKALATAAEVQKDPRLVEVILSEARRIVRSHPGVLIVEHRLGFILANAGVDQSNVDPAAGSEPVLLLPEDPDKSAQTIMAGLNQAFGRRIAVVINDSFGRAWRMGTSGTAIGCAGLPALLDLRGRSDLFGRKLQVSETGFADEIAAAASLVMGQAGEATPVVLMRGLSWTAGEAPASALVRDAKQDLFR